MCSNNNEVRITNGNFSADGLEEFTNYSCRIAGFSAPFVATTLGDSKPVHALRQTGNLSQCQPSACYKCLDLVPICSQYVYVCGAHTNVRIYYICNHAMHTFM